MKQGEKYNYEIIKYNHRRSDTIATTVDVVKGQSAAERAGCSRISPEGYYPPLCLTG
jgi:hypothetical protein